MVVMKYTKEGGRAMKVFSRNSIPSKRDKVSRVDATHFTRVRSRTRTWRDVTAGCILKSDPTLPNIGHTRFSGAWKRLPVFSSIVRSQVERKNALLLRVYTWKLVPYFADVIFSAFVLLAVARSGFQVACKSSTPMGRAPSGHGLIYNLRKPRGENFAAGANYSRVSPKFPPWTWSRRSFRNLWALRKRSYLFSPFSLFFFDNYRPSLFCTIQYWRKSFEIC